MLENSWVVGALQVHSGAEFERMLGDNADRLVVLMCKAMACRPCKVWCVLQQPLSTRVPAGCCVSALLVSIVTPALCPLRQMFARKFERLAASYSDAVFCDILGDENNDTRVRYRASQRSLASLSRMARLRAAAVPPECWRLTRLGACRGS